MSKVAIVTDSNSGILQEEANKIENLFVIPMPFMINDEEYFEGINLTKDEFYKMLANDCEISTSKPSLGSVIELWDSILKEYDEIVHIPMSSSLSSACETAINFATEYNGKVQVVDNQRISVTLRQSVEDALKLAKEGKTAEEIKNYLLETKADSSIYIMVPTLKYLKRGGRITPAAAAIGTLLKIKPVLQIQGGKLDSYAKALNEKVAKEKMIGAIKKDLETRFKQYVDNNEMEISIAHTNCIDKANEFAKQVQQEFPGIKIRYIDPLSLSVSCHIGEGSLAITCERVYKK